MDHLLLFYMKQHKYWVIKYMHDHPDGRKFYVKSDLLHPNDFDVKNELQEATVMSEMEARDFLDDYVRFTDPELADEQPLMMVPVKTAVLRFADKEIKR